MKTSQTTKGGMSDVNEIPVPGYSVSRSGGMRVYHIRPKTGVAIETELL